MCDQVREVIARQLPGGTQPEDLVLPGPGGSNGIPRGARAPLSTTNLRRVHKAAVEAAGADLTHLELRGPHDLRHTFATWLEDAAIPSRVIDELMGHTSGRPDHAAGGSPMGRIYRETGVARHCCWRIAGNLEVIRPLRPRLNRHLVDPAALPLDPRSYLGPNRPVAL